MRKKKYFATNQLYECGKKWYDARKKINWENSFIVEILG